MGRQATLALRLASALLLAGIVLASVRCGEDDKKKTTNDNTTGDKKNTPENPVPATPTSPGGEAPADWDGTNDYTGSAFGVTEE